jgi:hypothetical protein
VGPWLLGWCSCCVCCYPDACLSQRCSCGVAGPTCDDSNNTMNTGSPNTLHNRHVATLLVLHDVAVRPLFVPELCSWRRHCSCAACRHPTAWPTWLCRSAASWSPGAASTPRTCQQGGSMLRPSWPGPRRTTSTRQQRQRQGQRQQQLQGQQTLPLAVQRAMPQGAAARAQQQHQHQQGQRQQVISRGHQAQQQ